MRNDSMLLNEDYVVLSAIEKSGSLVLDVGCGCGRYLKPLRESGCRVVGVDLSRSQINALCAEGYTVYHPSDPRIASLKYDYIIMSHVIEHISPENLIEYFDKYLALLARDGALVISSPLLCDEFFDDYDHVKPYTPKAISVLFSSNMQQQAKPLDRLTLSSLWIRRWPLAVTVYPYEKAIQRKLKKLLNCLFKVAYYLSGCLLSRPTGWVGVFRHK